MRASGLVVEWSLDQIVRLGLSLFPFGRGMFSLFPRKKINKSLLVAGSFPFSLGDPPFPPTSYPTLVGLIGIHFFKYCACSGYLPPAAHFQEFPPGGSFSKKS